MVRILPPWSENAGKRLVKSPKLYFRDVGLLHHLAFDRLHLDVARLK